MLDIADNSIGNEGIKHMLQGIDPSKTSIVYINLSNNNLTQGSINELSNLLNSSNIQEIRLSNNQLTDVSVQELGYFFYRGQCQLQKLDLANTELTSAGVGILSHALKLNPFLTHLNLELNDFSKGDKFHKISLLLKTNKILKSLNLSKWELDAEDAEALAEGLYENTALTTLNLSKNRLMSEGAISIFESLQHENTKLENIDMSHNNIGDDAIDTIATTLEINNSLCKVNLFSNVFTEEIGKPIAASLKKNTSIMHINLAYNSIEKKDIVLIKECCRRNIQNAESKGLPHVRQQLVDLMKNEEGTRMTEDQLLRRVHQCKDERECLEKEFYNGQDKLDLVKQRQECMYNSLYQQYQQVTSHLDNLQNQEEQANEEYKQTKEKLDKNVEDYQLKLSVIKQQLINTQGLVQRTKDNIEILAKDHQKEEFKQSQKLDRLTKKMYVKKIASESMQTDIDRMKAEIEKLEKRANNKTISTLRKTRSSYYKSSKGWNKSPWKSCSPNKQKKRLVRLKCPNDYGTKQVEKSPEKCLMRQVSLFGNTDSIKFKTPSKDQFKLKRKLTIK